MTSCKVSLIIGVLTYVSISIDAKPQSYGSDFCSLEVCTPPGSTLRYTCDEGGNCVQLSDNNAYGESSSGGCSPEQCTPPGSQFAYTCDAGGRCIQTSEPSDVTYNFYGGCNPESCTPPYSIYKYTCDQGGNCVQTGELKDNVMSDLSQGQMAAQYVCSPEYCSAYFNDGRDYSCSEFGQCTITGGGSTGHFACDPQACKASGIPGYEYSCDNAGNCIQSTNY